MSHKESSTLINPKIINSSLIHFDNIPREVDDLIDSILRIYPEGLNSIIEESEKVTNNIALILVLHGTEAFVKKYIAKAQRRISLDRDSKVNEGILLTKIQENDNFNKYSLPLVKPTIKEMKNEINNKIKETRDTSNILLEIFSELNNTDDKLVERIISKYANNKAKDINSNSDYYSMCKSIIASNEVKMFNMFPDNKYYELGFEDFILLFCSIVHYYTGINIKLELRDAQSHKVMLLCYCNENNYNLLAEFFGYELQLKPYAFKFNEYCKNKLATVNENESKIISLTSSMKQNNQSCFMAKNEKELQFESLDHDNCLMFPPYMGYEASKDIKFRRYSPNDDYHECPVDPEFNEGITINCRNCSKYRSIDKLRLLYKSLTHIMPLSTLYKHRLISMIIYQKNYRAYDKKLQTRTLFEGALRISYGRRYMKTLNTIRNYFGENISFYFLWVSFFFSWMIFPALIGIIGSFIIVDQQLFKNEGKIDTFKNFRLDFYDISIIVFGLIITIWATMFLKAWLQYESLFRYFWGMEHYEKNEPQSEFFVPDKTIPFIIGESLKTVTSWKTQWRYIISFFVLVFMILLRFFIEILLFYFISSKSETNFNELVLIAGFSSISIKIMSFIYDYVAYKITILENHEKRSQLYNSLAFNLISFEFFNNYSGLFYIAFYKPYQKGIKCFKNNCLKELEYHLYIIVFINFFLNYLVELALFGLKKSIRMKKYNIDSRISAQSLAHQMSCDKKNNLIKEYNQKLIDFGYVCLFSVSAPLAPLIILILTYFQNLFDVYKIFNLYRIEMIDGSSGIEIYYSKFKLLNYLGMITNICLVLFTSPKLVHLDEYLNNKITSNEDFIIKIIIFAIIENVMLLFMKVIKYKDEMVWFQHLEDLKILYDKKYFNRDLKTLPHMSLDQYKHFKEE